MRIDMKFKVVDQLDKFAFREVQLSGCELKDGTFRMTMAGAISKYNNPCNERFQDWYILEAYARFENAEIMNCYKEGLKYYDANNVLQNEIPDMPIGEEEYAETLALVKNGVMFVLLEKEQEADKKCIEIAVDVECEAACDTYWITLTYDRCIIEWDRYANKVIES